MMRLSLPVVALLLVFAPITEAFTGPSFVGRTTLLSRTPSTPVRPVWLLESSSSSETHQEAVVGANGDSAASLVPSSSASSTTTTSSTAAASATTVVVDRTTRGAVVVSVCLLLAARFGRPAWVAATAASRGWRSRIAAAVPSLVRSLPSAQLAATMVATAAVAFTTVWMTLRIRAWAASLESQLTKLNTRVQTVDQAVQVQVNDLQSSTGTQLERVETRLDALDASLQTQLQTLETDLTNHVDRVQIAVGRKLDAVESLTTSQYRKMGERLTEASQLSEAKLQSLQATVAQQMEHVEVSLHDKLDLVQGSLQQDMAVKSSQTKAFETTVESQFSTLTERVGTLDDKFNRIMQEMDLLVVDDEVKKEEDMEQAVLTLLDDQKN